MSARPELSDDGRSVTVQVPLAFPRRGGRKQVVTANGVTASAPRPSPVRSTLVKAIARAHRWQAMLERGGYGSIEELAGAEGINSSYLARMLRLTLLAPEITERILDGRHDREHVTLGQLMEPFPVEWDEQAGYFGRARVRSAPESELGPAPKSRRSAQRPRRSPKPCRPLC